MTTVVCWLDKQQSVPYLQSLWAVSDTHISQKSKDKYTNIAVAKSDRT